MEFNKEAILKEAKFQAEEHGLFFIEDIIAYIPCGRSTFYLMFPNGSDGSDSIKEILLENRIKKKVELRQKLSDGKGVELLALYKLIGTEEERKKLSQTYHDLSTNGKDLQVTGFLPGGFED